MNNRSVGLIFEEKDNESVGDNLENRKEGTMENMFSALGVSEEIVKSVEEMGFSEPTIVQKEAIPYILNNKDLIVRSKTGSGKTGAFGIPMLQNVDVDIKKPQALILTPTRELAVQVDKELGKMSKYKDIKTTAVYGQHNIKTEINAINDGAAVITGTPGRVSDHIKQRNINTSSIRYLVLDEADRMLDMGFIDQVIKIIKTLPKERVTMLFSATMPPEIHNICYRYMNEPESLELGTDAKTVDTIKQLYYRVDKKEKRMWLNNLLHVYEPESCMIFCNTRSEVDWVYKYLIKKGYEIGALHGGNSQNSRMRTMEKFQKGKLQLIVATDVAARGLHIDDLGLVVNYDVPFDNDSYVHRVGRTGRVGNEGLAITMVTQDDLWDFYAVEEHVGVLIEETQLPDEEEVKKAKSELKGKWAAKRKERVANKDFKDHTLNHDKKNHPKSGGRNKKNNSGNRNKDHQHKPKHQQHQHKQAKHDHHSKDTKQNNNNYKGNNKNNNKYSNKGNNNNNNKYGNNGNNNGNNKYSNNGNNKGSNKYSNNGNNKGNNKYSNNGNNKYNGNNNNNGSNNSNNKYNNNSNNNKYKNNQNKNIQKNNEQTVNRNIDYRAEAKKLMDANKKPSLMDRITGIFKK